MFDAGIFKTTDTIVSGNLLRNRNIDVNEDFTLIPNQESGCLYGSHIIVSVDAADMFCFPLDSNDRNMIGGQFF